MLGLIARSLNYQVLHGMPYLLMSNGDKDKLCNAYPLASAMMMYYAAKNEDVFKLTPKEVLMLIDGCDMKCVLKEAKVIGQPMNLNGKYNSNLKLSKYDKVDIKSLDDLYTALDEHKVLYSGIFDDGTFGGIELVAERVEGVSGTNHAAVISSVGKFKDTPGLYVEVVNAWNQSWNCGGVMYVKISEDETTLINNLCLFNDNYWVEVEYSDNKYKLLFGLTIGFAVAFGLSILLILCMCKRRMRGGDTASV